jgi:exonuclease III
MNHENKNCIVHWNIRGLREKKSHLNLLISELNPFLIALQETKISGDSFTLKGFVKFQNDSKGLKGGEIIFVKENISCKKVNLVTKISAIAVKIFYPIELTVCNVYWRTKCTKNIVESDWINLIDQLGKEFLLIGDFNAHNTLWGSESTKPRGEVIENFIASKNLLVLNSGTVTHVPPNGNKPSAIDLSIATQKAAEIFDWGVDGELRFSDHYPVILRTEESWNNNVRKKWKIDEADWQCYQTNLKFEKLKNTNTMSIEQHEETFRKIVIEAANKAIPKSSGKKPKRFVPW